MPLCIDHLTLAVEDLVILQNVLADLEVLRLHLTLRAGNRTGDHLGLNRNVVGHVETGQERVDHRRVEPLHEIVPSDR